MIGAGVSLDGDGDGDDVEHVRNAGMFTVATPWVQRAATALARVSPQLMNVDEHGNILARGELPAEDVYTPNFVFDVEVCHYAAAVKLDTRGVMFSAMGRTMVGMIVASMAADRIPAHITGYCPDLDPEWRIWQPPEKAD